MVEAPFLMKFLTRFTEEIFTGLIALIFVWEAAKFMYKEFTAHPLKDLETYCNVFTQKNKSTEMLNDLAMNFTSLNSTRFNGTYCKSFFCNFILHDEL